MIELTNVLYISWHILVKPKLPPKHRETVGGHVGGVY